MQKKTQPADHRQEGQGRHVAGLIVVDSSGEPVYLNDEAVRILSYPENSQASQKGSKFLALKIQATLPSTKGSSKLDSASLFKSGRRGYICRSFSVTRLSRKGRWPTVAFLLERDSATKDLLLLSNRFHLTQREREAVQLLTHGLTSKEIANRMGVSPNTVKAFLRLVMIKTGVTTRSGIVGKFLQP